MTKNMQAICPGIKNKAKPKSVGEIIFIVGLLAYPIIQWVVFWLYPNIRTFVLPFMEWNPEIAEYQPCSDGVFYNFQMQIEQFLQSGNGTEHSGLYMAFFNTFHSLWINLILLPLAVIIGYALSKHVPGEKFFRVIFFMPNIISTVVMCFVFRFMFEDTGSAFTGPVASLLKSLGSSFNGWDTRKGGQALVPVNPVKEGTVEYTFIKWVISLTSNYSVVFSCNYKVVTDTKQNQFHLVSKDTKEKYTPISSCIVNNNGTCHMGKSSKDGTSKWADKKNALTNGNTYKLEFGRVARLYNGEFTGEYYEYLKINDAIILQGVYGIPESIANFG